MMFLLRAAFWLGLVLVLLPTGSKTQDTSQIKAADAASAATAAVADLSNFCTRQPDTCAVGSQVAAALGQRAEACARMLYEFFTEYREAPAAARRDGVEQADLTGSIAAAAMLPRPRPMPSQDTLTASDRETPWRAPQHSREARLRQPI
jgi:hypothetical protein